MNVFRIIFILNVNKLQFWSSNSCPPDSDSLICNISLKFPKCIELAMKYCSLTATKTCNHVHIYRNLAISRLYPVLGASAFVCYKNDNIHHKWVARSHKTNILLIMNLVTEEFFFNYSFQGKK